MTKKMGRPTKLTPELIDKLSDIVRKGNYQITACNACGIHKTTLYDWLERGEEDIRKGETSLYTDLINSLKRAEADAEAKMLEIVRNAAVESKNWIAAMTYLERRHPDRWGRKERTQVTIDEHKQVTITHVEVVKDYGAAGKIVESEAREIPEQTESQEQG